MHLEAHTHRRDAAVFCLLRSESAAAYCEKIRGGKRDGWDIRGTMDTELTKGVVRQVVDDWNRGDLDALDEHLDPEYVHRDPNNPDVTDRTSYKRWAAAARTAFPDLTVTINDLIAEDDRVAKLWSLTATHKGEYLGIAPTGRRVTWSGITIYRVRAGKVVECIWRTDALGLLQQLGVISMTTEPPVGAAAAGGVHS